MEIFRETDVGVYTTPISSSHEVYAVYYPDYNRLFIKKGDRIIDERDTSDYTPQEVAEIIVALKRKLKNEKKSKR